MPNLSPTFYSKLLEISSELGMKPEDILNIMVSESGLKSSISNLGGEAAIGLIQFTPKTLKGLGYDKDWKEFGKVPAVQQLDYVKRYIQGQANYRATFWPVALKLPGVKDQNPDTPIVEAHPATVKDQQGNSYSKKYYDIGIKISPQYEALAYNKNTLFHGSTPGAITYGDMMRQTDKNSKTSLYRQALNEMHSATGYQAQPTQEPTQIASQEPAKSHPLTFLEKLENLVKRFVLASEENNFLIVVGSSSDQIATIEYARILSTALQEYLGAKTSICADPYNIEIECKASGGKLEVFNAIKELSEAVADTFKYATRDVGDITPFSLVACGVRSDYEPLHPRTADVYSRMFKIKFLGVK